MVLTLDEQRIEDDATSFAKANKKAIAKRLTDPSIYIAEAEPVSVFMASSPGAGKTEAALELLERIGGSGSTRTSYAANSRAIPAAIVAMA